MATQQYDATDANGQTVQLTNSDDPAEGGGATLQDIVSALQSPQDVSGGTVTVTDDGAFNVTLDAQNAGLAQDSSVQSVLSELQGTLDVSVGAASSAQDGSGTISSAGTSEQVFASNPDRNTLFFQNLSDTDMYLDFGSAAVQGQPSILVPANGGNYSGPSFTDEVQVICPSAGKEYTAKQA
jgi:hypothetical protein